MRTLARRSHAIATATRVAEPILLVFFRVSGFTGEPDYDHFDSLVHASRKGLLVFSA